jgi:hypothetical protein
MTRGNGSNASKQLIYCARLKLYWLTENGFNDALCPRFVWGSLEDRLSKNRAEQTQYEVEKKLWQLKTLES